MSSCTPLSVRTGALVVVFGLGLASAAPVWAADIAPTTVRAVIGADGKVVSVSRTGGVAAPAADALPITMAITGSQAGGVRTTNYHVENTTSKTEDLQITQPDGSVKTVQQTVQTPYVAQLHVSVPASLTDVIAPGAEVVADADGSHELTWSMVLFSPVGSPISEVSFTSKGSGAPTARLDSVAVSPNGTAGLGATGQAANAAVAGNGTLGALTAGANDGLTKLAAGVGQIVAGLEAVQTGAGQLHTGLAAGAAGTNQLAAGLHSAKAGSGQLSGGLGQIAAGTGKLSTGTGLLAGGSEALHHGTGQLVAGLQKASDGSVLLVNGSQDLATGAGLTAAGASQLSAGLKLISGGLGSLGADAGLPAAKVGALALKAGVDKILQGLGDPGSPLTILGGLAGLDKALSDVKLGTAALANPSTGLQSAVDGLISLKGAVDTKVLPGVDGVQQSLASGSATGGGIDAIRGLVTKGGALSGCTMTGSPVGVPVTNCDYLNTAVYAIDHAQTTADPKTGGLKQQSAYGAYVLGLVSAGLKNPYTGTDTTKWSVEFTLSYISGALQKAADGITAIDKGIGAKSDGATSIRGGLALVNGGVLQVTQGLRSGDPSKPGISEGLDALIAGLTSAITGVGQLSGGAGSAYAGSVALADGTAKVAAGAGQLSEVGAVPLSGGLAQLLAGGQKIDTGAGQLAAGAGQLNTGAGQLNAGVIKAYDGSKALDAGIGKISAGTDKLAAGLPAAVTGSGALEAGAGKLLAGGKAVGAGLGAVKSQATGVLASQLAAGTNNAKVQLAALDATSARLTSDPAAVGTTYVLTQNAAGVTMVKASGTDHTMRNIGIAAGGALLLLGGLGAGFLSGRRQGGVA